MRTRPSLKDFYELENQLLADDPDRDVYSGIGDDIYSAVFVYYVPLAEIQQNIHHFLHIHKKYLTLKAYGVKNESEVLTALTGTEYHELARNCLLEKEQSENNTDFVEEFLESIQVKTP